MIISDADAADPLFFTRYPMRDAAPISTLFSIEDPAGICGIYVLEFDDGDRYVGKTVNIVSRYATHKRQHGDVAAFSFAPCEAALLDYYERAVIRHEQRSHNLRNLMLTDWPGGRDDLEIALTEASAVQLPWKRNRRDTAASEPKTSKERRFWELAGRPDYSWIRSQLARYVHEAIPDPTRTRGILWSLTALPSTGRTADRRRLFTLNAGSVEMLVLTEWELEGGGTELEWTMNIWPEGVIEPLQALKGDWLNGATYRHNDEYKSAGPVVTIECVGTAIFTKALDQPMIIDAAYRLNVTMMRRAKTIYAKHHNESFTSDVIRGIYSLGLTRQASAAN
jgi:hypothetical protein